MAEQQQTREEIETTLIVKAMKDDAFRQELLANPKAAIAKALNKPLPEDIQVVVHEETAKTFHLVLPPKLGAGERQLSDAELETVAAGAGAGGCGGKYTEPVCFPTL